MEKRDSCISPVFVTQVNKRPGSNTENDVAAWSTVIIHKSFVIHKSNESLPTERKGPTEVNFPVDGARS